MDNDQNPVPQTPSVPETEMKMPEEQVIAPQPEARGRRAFIPLLVGVLVLLLGILGALLVWGDEIIDTFMPVDTAEDVSLTPATSTDPAVTDTDASETEADLSAIEAELEGEDFSEFEAEMSALDAELAATSTAE